MSRYPKGSKAGDLPKQTSSVAPATTPDLPKQSEPAPAQTELHQVTNWALTRGPLQFITSDGVVYKSATAGTIIQRISPDGAEALWEICDLDGEPIGQAKHLEGAFQQAVQYYLKPRKPRAW